MTLLIKEMAASERPRERLLEKGADALSSEELIAILLRTGMKGHSAVQIARQLLARFKTLRELAGASIDDLRATKGIGRDKAIALQSAFNLAKRMAKELAGEAPLLDSPERVADYLREDLRPLQVETLQVLLLNTRRRLIRLETVANGLVDTLLVHPREVFRRAIAGNASAIVVVHNHPSGDPSPSEADIKVTRDLIRAGELLKIEVLDHVIIGRHRAEQSRDYISLRELGYFHS